MHLYGEGLKADGGVQRVLFHVRPALSQGLGVDDLVVLAEAQVDDALSAAGGRGYKAGRGKHIVADVLDLPKHGIAAAQAVDGAVKAVDAASDAPCRVHVPSSFLYGIKISYHPWGLFSTKNVWYSRVKSSQGGLLT